MSRTRTALAAGLVALGLGAAAADLAGADGLRRALATTGASPLPGGPLRRSAELSLPGTRVFVLFADGREPVELDAARLEGLRGPARRRALFRLAIARGPELADDLGRRERFRALLAHAFAPGSSVRSELGLDPEAEVDALQYQAAARAAGSEPVLVEVPSP